MNVHVVKDWPIESSWWTMRCGLVVLVGEDGSLSPDVDFTIEPDERTSCAGCYSKAVRDKAKSRDMGQPVTVRME